MADTEREVASLAEDEGDDESVPDGLILGPMLRWVGATEATVWVETARPGTVSVLGCSTSTFTVRDKHYALVIVEGLEPGSVTPYDVHLDDRPVWPMPDSELPPSVIRTTGRDDDRVSMLVGSCRAAAPHEAPYTSEAATDDRGRGVDSLWAHARRMVDQEPTEWPSAVLLVGDQIYADDSSPNTKERIERRRDSDCDLPPEIVANFDEYCWLYHEAWSPALERWLFSVLPTMMIFDDHDVIDDWNISAAWIAETHEKPWWEPHAVGSVMSYWIYQHLGNLSPDEIRADGMLAELTAVDDASERLEQWAGEVNDSDPGDHRFSYFRDVGEIRIVVIDCRHGRVLEADRRLMVNESEWEWVRDRALEHSGHLVLATTLPVFISSGLHDLQVWNERVCDGAWGRRAGRWAESVRRSLDLEDWSAFDRSYTDFVELLETLYDSGENPASVVIASGDIHFSYTAKVAVGPSDARVHQVVSSPIRNALIPPERGVMRFTLTGVGRRIGALLRRLTGARPNAIPIEMTTGPYFANNMCVLAYDGDHAEVTIEQAVPDGDGGGVLNEVARTVL
ncbi:alkaline phosphatase family protein [Ilumatobacter sp.]|uniref:DUF7800 domain-containing protein n=1 Tax=Ilumatobacter sp. TaxID=1967498 RepID=UPI003C5DF54C